MNTSVCKQFKQECIPVQDWGWGVSVQERGLCPGEGFLSRRVSVNKTLPWTETPWKEHGTKDRNPPGRNMGSGSQTGSNIIHRPLSPCEQNDCQTGVKTLPCPKLHLRLATKSKGRMHTGCSGHH